MSNESIPAAVSLESLKVSNFSHPEVYVAIQGIYTKLTVLSYWLEQEPTSRLDIWRRPEQDVLEARLRNAKTFSGSITMKAILGEEHPKIDIEWVHPKKTSQQLLSVLNVEFSDGQLDVRKSRFPRQDDSDQSIIIFDGKTVPSDLNLLNVVTMTDYAYQKVIDYPVSM